MEPRPIPGSPEDPGVQRLERLLMSVAWLVAWPSPLGLLITLFWWLAATPDTFEQTFYGWMFCSFLILWLAAWWAFRRDDILGVLRRQGLAGPARESEPSNPDAVRTFMPASITLAGQIDDAAADDETPLPEPPHPARESRRTKSPPRPAKVRAAIAAASARAGAWLARVGAALARWPWLKIGAGIGIALLLIIPALSLKACLDGGARQRAMNAERDADIAEQNARTFQGEKQQTGLAVERGRQLERQRADTAARVAIAQDVIAIAADGPGDENERREAVFAAHGAAVRELRDEAAAAHERAVSDLRAGGFD